MTASLHFEQQMSGEHRDSPRNMYLVVSRSLSFEVLRRMIITVSVCERIRVFWRGVAMSALIVGRRACLLHQWIGIGSLREIIVRISTDVLIRSEGIAYRPVVRVRETHRRGETSTIEILRS